MPSISDGGAFTIKFTLPSLSESGLAAGLATVGAVACEPAPPVIAELPVSPVAWPVVSIYTGSEEKFSYCFLAPSLELIEVILSFVFVPELFRMLFGSLELALELASLRIVSRPARLLIKTKKAWMQTKPSSSRFV